MIESWLSLLAMVCAGLTGSDPPPMPAIAYPGG
jgi:hypothetical protein